MSDAKPTARFLVLSGPNLDRLGKREPHVYGHQTLEDIHGRIQELSRHLGVVVACRQSNHEGQLIDWMNSACADGFAGIAINPGALTHYSWALHDSIKGCELPVVEVHLSNPASREEFRRHSCVAPACLGTVAGFGPDSYLLALRALCSSAGA